MAAGADDPDVSHAAPAPGRFPGRVADARGPAHLRLAGSQLVSEWAAFRLVLEQGNGQAAAPAASLRISGEAAWRLLTGARHDARQVRLSGDPALAGPLLRVRGIIV